MREQVLLAGGRIVRHQQDARTAQRHGILEARLAQTVGRDLARQRDGAGRVHAGLQAQVIGAGDELHLVGADRFAFGRHLHGSLRGARRFQRHLDGETLAAEDLAGNRNRFQQQSRLGAAGQRHGIDGDAELLRLPDGARHAAQVFVAVGDQQQARHHAGGQRGGAVANGGFQIGAVARRAGGVAQLPAVLGVLVERGDCASRGRTGSRAVQWRPRARSTRSASADSVRRSSGETLADVSASIATATLVS